MSAFQNLCRDASEVRGNQEARHHGLYMTQHSMLSYLVCDASDLHGMLLKPREGEHLD